MFTNEKKVPPFSLPIDKFELHVHVHVPDKEAIPDITKAAIVIKEAASEIVKEVQAATFAVIEEANRKQ